MQYTRRFFLAAGAALAAAPETGEQPLLLFRPAEAERMRRPTAGTKPILEALRAHATSAMNNGPWSVTFAGPRAPSGEPNDYWSDAPYWWPDPKNPKGPYIRRDGERNPERFVQHHDDLGRLGQAVLSLGAAAWLFGEGKCAERARLLLRTWFLDSKTRMNPHLEYAQALRGHNSGRGAGIIDARPLIAVVQGMKFLEGSGLWSETERKAVQEWYAAFLKWLTESEKGKDEKKAGNNHTNWWTAQVASYAAFTDNARMERMCWDYFREGIIPKQMRPDGSCPREESRTRSLSYSAMNLDALALICRMGGLRDVDLWHFRAASGAGMEKGVAYVLPYLVSPATWKKQQISSVEPGDYMFPALASLGLRNADYAGAYRDLAPKKPDVWRLSLSLLMETTYGDHLTGMPVFE